MTDQQEGARTDGPTPSRGVTKEDWEQLPQRVRDYIRDLETNADPGATVQDLYAVRENYDGTILTLSKVYRAFRDAQKDRRELREILAKATYRARKRVCRTCRLEPDECDGAGRERTRHTGCKMQAKEARRLERELEQQLRGEKPLGLDPKSVRMAQLEGYLAEYENALIAIGGYFRRASKSAETATVSMPIGIVKAITRMADACLSREMAKEDRDGKQPPSC